MRLLHNSNCNPGIALAVSKSRRKGSDRWDFRTVLSMAYDMCT